MSLRKKGQYVYGKTPADIRKVLVDYSEGIGDVAVRFAQAKCRCGRKVFALRLDDAQGAAVRICDSCEREHAIGDSAEYLEDAKLDECACPCGGESFQIVAGVALYDDSEDVKWIYLCCRCVKCELIAVYGDWANEFEGYRKLMKRV